MGGVASFLGDVVDTVGSVAGDLWSGVVDLVTEIWRGVVVPILEFVFSLLGIVDEDILHTNVLNQRILKDDTGATLVTRALLEYMQNETPILETIVVANAAIKGRYSKYYSRGANLAYGYPDASLRLRVVDATTVKTILDGINSHDNNIISVSYKQPEKEEWVAWNLQLSHAYKPYSNRLTYAGNTDYEMYQILYNYSTNNYDVTARWVANVTTNIYTRTAVTITPVDAIHDNRNAKTYTVTETIHEYSGTSSSSILVSDVDTLIPIGSEVNSDTSVLDSSTPSIDVMDSVVIEVNSGNVMQMYVATYEWVVGEWYYWIYDPSTGVYPEFNINNQRVSGLEMLPIVAIRNNGVNVADTPTSDEYKATKAILAAAGVDIDTLSAGLGDPSSTSRDAFIYFGINPTETGSAVSKLLYRMADVIYTDAELYTTVVNNETVYAFNINEGTFNQVCKWSSQTREVIEGVIGAENAYVHTVSGTTMSVSKQITPETYIKYTFYNVTSLTAVRYGGMANVVTVDLGDSNFRIPLSKEFIRGLTANEQYYLYLKALTISVYAAEIQHLEWYETEAFGQLLQVAGIIIFIISCLTGCWGALIMVALSYVLKMILSSNAPEWLKIVAMVIFVDAAIYTGGGYGGASGLMTAVTAAGATASAATMYTAAKAEELQRQYGDWRGQAERRQSENEAKEKNLDTMYSSQFVAGMVVNPAYASPSTFYGVAKGELLYNYNIYYNMSDRAVTQFYDNKFRVGSY